MANTKPSDVAVLNVIQAAAADVVLSGGKLQINNGTLEVNFKSITAHLTF
jgi:hypothetical protein